MNQEFDESLNHTCERHRQYDYACKSCVYWKRQGKCSPKKFKKTDFDLLYRRLVKNYMENPKFMYPKEKANQIAMKVCEEQRKVQENRLKVVS